MYFIVFGSISSLNKLYTKEGNITYLQTKIKTKLQFVCTQNENISLFGLTSGHKRSCDSAMENQIFANLLSNIHIASKKKVMSDTAESMTV